MFLTLTPFLDCFASLNMGKGVWERLHSSGNLDIFSTQISIMASHRLGMIQRHLSTGTQVCIGNVCIPIPKSSHPEQIPANLFSSIYDNQELLNHLRWMMQKDALNQDIFLYGPPGPFKRRLALSYLSITRQEYEYFHLNPDTTSESDLKQRREIAVNNQGSQELMWIDGVCVRAALLGRCLVIEGIEKGMQTKQ